MAEWWVDFFDDEYLAVWGTLFSQAQCQAEADTLIELLALPPGAQVLDAPCGFGRFSRALSARGFAVTGVDQSSTLLARARESCTDGNTPIRYIQADLRAAVPALNQQFDAVVNLFSSIGYATEEDDKAIFRTLRDALKKGGRVFVDTMHRDAVVARIARGQTSGSRLEDGTRLWEEPCFDAVSGRMNTTWRWSGPRGEGKKSASLRIYSVTELVALLESVGFEMTQCYAGISEVPLLTSDVGERLGLLATKR